MTLRWRGLLVPAVLTLLALAVLVSLGNWQMNRLAWKTELTAAVEQRARKAPIPVEEVDWRTDADLEFTRVRLSGSFSTDTELHVMTPNENGLSWTVITPFEPGPWLVIRGVVPDGQKDVQSRPPPPRGPVEIVGRLRRDEQPGWMTPENDPARNIWFYRDAEAMSASVNAAAEGRPGYFIEMEAGPFAGKPPASTPGVLRVPPSRHLGYAVTWYGLAAALLAVFGSFAWTRLRGDGGARLTPAGPAP